MGRSASSRCSPTRSPGCGATSARSSSRVVGVPGIGKSRLVHELWQQVDDDPDLIVWRRGRSLPYGEGIAYWALGEIVKAQAGILESDDAPETEAKLGAAVASAPVRSGRGSLGRAPSAPPDRPPGRRDDAFPGGGVRRPPPLPRGARRGRARDPRLRGHPLGGRRPARLRRRAGRPARLGAAPDRLHRPPGAPVAAAGLGRGQVERHHGVARAALRRRHGPPARRAARPVGAARRDAGGAAASRGRSSALCRGVRAADRRRRADVRRSGDAAGNRRRADRRARSRREVAAPGRLRAREGVLDGCPGRALVVLGVGAGRAPAVARATRVRQARASLGGRGRAPVHLPPRPRPRHRLRADPARGPRRQAPPYGRVDRGAPARTGGGPRGDARPPPGGGDRVRRGGRPRRRGPAAAPRDGALGCGRSRLGAQHAASGGPAVPACARRRPAGRADGASPAPPRDCALACRGRRQRR